MAARSDIEDVLRQKRAEINREVEAFRAAKDDEFRRFDAHMRARQASKHFDDQETPRPLSPPPNKAPTGPRVASPLAQSCNEDIHDGDDSSRPTDDHGLRSVFAPSYIALVDPRARPASPPSSTSPPKPAPRAFTHPPPHLSTPDSFDGAPPDPALTSTSDPASNTLRGATTRSLTAAMTDHTPGGHQRRASSSPVTGTVLRSSLRRPTSPPRRAGAGAPKHVLFNIDNALLSPSSSPLARRDGPGPHRPLRLPPASASRSGKDLTGTPPGGRRPVVVEGPGVGPDLEGGDDDDEAAIMIPRISPARIPPPRPLLSSPPRRSYKELVEPTTVGPGAGGSDVAEPDDSDPLFDFQDESAGASSAEWEEEDPENESEGEERGGKNEEEEEGDESPKAGSLPIEIKWPGRR